MKLRSFVGVAALVAAATSALADVGVRADLPGQYVDITQVGTRYNLGDDGVVSITTSVGNRLIPAGSHLVSNNGAVSLNNGNGTGFTNQPIPTANLANGAQALAVYWDDLFTYSRPKGQEDGVFVHQTEDVLYITWRLGHISAGGQGLIQLQVFAKGPVLAQMVYPDVNFDNGTYNNGASATVGYQGAGVGNDAMYSFNAPGSIPNGAVLSIVDPQAVPVSIVGDIAGHFRPVSGGATYFNLGDDGQTNVTTTAGNLLLPAGLSRVSNNGAVAWGNTNGTGFSNASLPSANLANGDQALAVYWDDLYTYPRAFPEVSDGVYFEEANGTAYFTWVLGHIAAGGQGMIQLQVHTSGPVYAQYLYRDVDFLNGNFNNGASATIGYQSGGLAGVTQFSFNAANSVGAGTVLSLVDARDPVCRADFNGDGIANSQDFFDFLVAFFAGCP
jgi:hypothetical protein